MLAIVEAPPSTYRRLKAFAVIPDSNRWTFAGKSSCALVRCNLMPLAGFDTWITPADRFFVRTHIYKPKVELADWRLHVDGLVEREVTPDMAELKKLPRAEQVAVLECAGNGRSF